MTWSSSGVLHTVVPEAPMPISAVRAPSVWARLLLVVALLAASLLVAVPGEAEAALKAPTGLKAKTTAATSVTLTWKKVSKAPRYRLQWSTTPTMSKSTYKRSTKPTATLAGLKPGTTYYVKVRVISKSGKNLSKYSKALKVRTRAAAAGGTGTSGGTTSGGTGTSGGTTPPTKPVAGDPLRVASYNIKCANCYRPGPEELPWEGRRQAVVDTILGEDLDVVGLQEAGQGWLKDANGKPVSLSQFEDLTNRLGGSWTLTNVHRNNCVRSTTPSSCVYKDQGASQDTKIIFDASRVEMLDQGSKQLPYVDADDNDRYVAWAQFRQRSTGNRFMFASTHLEPTKDPAGSSAYHDLRKRQTEVALAAVREHNPEQLPVIFVGDLNSSRFPHAYSPTNAPYDVLVKGGLIDPLGAGFRTTTTAPGATVEKRVNTFVDSFNDFDRTVHTHPKWVNGSYIDYMFVSPSVRVTEWETVVRMDAAGRFVGVIPSDHNMIDMSVVLPSRP
jgi:endonuclease/exonuclease/phosphatase family metal-dependent hydrolase